MATVAKTSVNARRQEVVDSNPIPKGVKYRIKPIIGTITKLKPKLRATRTIFSKLPLIVRIGNFVGKSVFMKLKPGKNKIKIKLKTLRM